VKRRCGMIKPKEVAERVKKKIEAGVRAKDAIGQVAKELGLRWEDVEIAAVVWIEELWELWRPNQRKK